MSYRVLKLIATGYLAIYLISIVGGIIQHDLSFSETADILALLLFIFFASGYAVSWFNETAGGILFQLWHLAIWILSLFVWDYTGNDTMEVGMVFLLAFPVLIIGVLQNLSACNRSGGKKRTDEMQWRFVFRLLLINYTVLYFVLVLSDLLAKNLPDMMSWPFILFPVLLVIYISGLFLSWTNAYIAGILFVFWYLIIVAATIISPDFSRNVPYSILGFPILLQGLLYFKHKIRHL
jgi:hypothetical protein